DGHAEKQLSSNLIWIPAHKERVVISCEIRKSRQLLTSLAWIDSLHGAMSSVRTPQEKKRRV
ncbi:MAG TPA: hypothetical protein VNU68_27165, partial [Verrucomicrobiae bacterium]|nr:hypothetical protein [Verrucomicrobiae bacterium]